MFARPGQLSGRRLPKIARLAGKPYQSLPARRALTCTACRKSAASNALPRVGQPSVWTSLIPAFLRKRSSEPGANTGTTVATSREWNPATFFIVIFLLIGSQAIQMIALRSELTTFSRRADAKIGLLKEVIERVQRGEDVDVEGLLGTGDKAKEKEWEEVLKEIEEEDTLWQAKVRRGRSEQRQHDASNPTETSESKAEHMRMSAFGEAPEQSQAPSIKRNPAESSTSRPGFY